MTDPSVLHLAGPFEASLIEDRVFVAWPAGTGA
jgi:hypothetical protein